MLTTFLFSFASLCSFADEIPILPGGNPGDDTGEIVYRYPFITPIQCEWDSLSSVLVVEFLDNLGSATIEIENLTTGEYSQSVVNALAGPMLLPISGTVGQWQITFTLSSGTVYFGDFIII
ncbi:MAG: DUF3244 domain-containing protein [Bacteroidales bacterium]|nr:DUF3244 domain-containing protein [Bacteroidales bacterium]